MKFNVKNNSNENVYQAMRRLGYRYQETGREKGEMSFVRPIVGVSYPRFHIYLTENQLTGEFSISLHLDQKKPSYQGQTVHSGERDTELVQQEAERIKAFFQGAKM